MFMGRVQHFRVSSLLLATFHIARFGSRHLYLLNHLLSKDYFIIIIAWLALISDTGLTLLVLKVCNTTNTKSIKRAILFSFLRQGFSEYPWLLGTQDQAGLKLTNIHLLLPPC